MKVSLTFQPSVKPLYKRYCIDKIQQTITQIKNHFLFSKKQNIYHVQQIPLKQQYVNKNQKIQRQFDKTVKKPSNFNQNSNNKNIQQQIQIINCSNQNFINTKSQNQNQKSVKLNNTSMQQIQKQKQKSQKLQLMQFLRKVETTLSYHTNFYQNLQQKLQLMNQKQNYLQKFIAQLQNLKEQKKLNNLKQKDPKELSQYSQKIKRKKQQVVVPLSSITFRKNKSMYTQQSEIKEQALIQKFVRKSSQTSNGIKKQQLYSYLVDDQFNCPIQFKQFKQQIKNQVKLNHTDKSKMQINTKNVKEQKKNHEVQTQQFSQISQNANFLISFMRLEQQFNKIIRKSKLQHSNDTKFNKQSPSNFQILMIK